MSGVRHLYVHLPFCAHRCGYCDFVTVVGRSDEHGTYVDALLAELAWERAVLADPVETIFLGGGTPTFTEPAELARLLAAFPVADELTVEANPETVTPELARLLRDGGVNRVSLGAQSFRAELLSVLERRARPDDVRRAVHTLRDAGFDNISLDLIYGIPGQSASDLESDLAEALALEPEHLSCYELEAKPGTRFTHAHGDALARQAEAMEGYFEQVVETLTAAGYRWYETANFCLDPTSVFARSESALADSDLAQGPTSVYARSESALADSDLAQESGEAGGRDLRARHNLAYWWGRDYLGVGIGAVSTLGGVRRRNLPSLSRYVGSLLGGAAPPREVEALDDETRAWERLLLGLRLDDPLRLDGVGGALDGDAAERLAARGLVELAGDNGASTIVLTRRGRFLGGAVTAELLVER